MNNFSFFSYCHHDTLWGDTILNYVQTIVNSSQTKVVLFVDACKSGKIALNMDERIFYRKESFDDVSVYYACGERKTTSANGPYSRALIAVLNELSHSTRDTKYGKFSKKINSCLPSSKTDLTGFYPLKMKNKTLFYKNLIPEYKWTLGGTAGCLVKEVPVITGTVDARYFINNNWGLFFSVGGGRLMDGYSILSENSIFSKDFTHNYYFGYDSPFCLNSLIGISLWRNKWTITIGGYFFTARPLKLRYKDHSLELALGLKYNVFNYKSHRFDLGFEFGGLGYLFNEGVYWHQAMFGLNFAYAFCFE